MCVRRAAAVAVVLNKIIYCQIYEQYKFLDKINFIFKHVGVGLCTLYVHICMCNGKICDDQIMDKIHYLFCVERKRARRRIIWIALDICRHVKQWLRGWVENLRCTHHTTVHVLHLILYNITLHARSSHTHTHIFHTLKRFDLQFCRIMRLEDGIFVSSSNVHKLIHACMQKLEIIIVNILYKLIM